MSPHLSRPDDAEPAIVVAVPPPSRAVRDGVAWLVVEILARRALADLGIVAENDNAKQTPR